MMNKLYVKAICIIKNNAFYVYMRNLTDKKFLRL